MWGNGVFLDGQGTGLETPSHRVLWVYPRAQGSGQTLNSLLVGCHGLAFSLYHLFLLWNQSLYIFGAFLKISLPSFVQVVKNDGHDVGKEKQLKK